VSALPPQGARQWLESVLGDIATALDRDDAPKESRLRRAFALGWIQGNVSKEAGEAFDEALKRKEGR